MRLDRRMMAVGVATLTAAACADAPLGIDGPNFQVEPDPLSVDVCKSWIDEDTPSPFASYTFEYTATSGAPAAGSVEVAVNDCATIGTSWTGATNVTLSEIVPAGVGVGQIWLLSRTEVDGDGFPVTQIIEAPAAPSVTFNVGAVMTVFFKNIAVEEPPVGFAGCTPGFWRQPHHYQYWAAPYSPAQTFLSAFGVDAFPGRTLGEVVQLGGGGLNALGRHAVAALLNAASAEVEYNLTVAEVIAGFQAAYASGNYNAQKDVFEGYNEQGCSVDKSNS